MIESMPLQLDRDGVYRVGSSRVSLDSLVHAFHQGCPPESIQQKYPSLNLVDVYNAIAYYLRHREELDAYIARRRAEAAETRRKIEALCPPDDLRERLSSRKRANRGR